MSAVPTRTRRVARRILWALACAALAAFVVGLVVVVVQVATTVDSIRETQKSSRSTLDVIEDCTQPAGECYRENERRTAGIVADIGVVSAYAAACADEPGVQGAAEVKACVLDRLAEERDSAR